MQDHMRFLFSGFMCCGVHMEPRCDEDAVFCTKCGRVVAGQDVLEGLEGIERFPPVAEDLEEVA